MTELTDPTADAYNAGRRDQLLLDSRAICVYCLSDNFEPSVWDEAYGEYRHTRKKKAPRSPYGDAPTYYCDASLLFEAWKD